MLKSNQDRAPQGRKVKERKLEVEDWFLEVAIIEDDDEPDPPPGGRSPSSRSYKRWKSANV